MCCFASLCSATASTHPPLLYTRTNLIQVCIDRHLDGVLEVGIEFTVDQLSKDWSRGFRVEIGIKFIVSEQIEYPGRRRT
jgi:hypothetical protein